MHIASINGLDGLVGGLLEAQANPNSQTLKPKSEGDVYRQTALHLAINHQQHDVIQTILDWSSKFIKKLKLVVWKKRCGVRFIINIELLTMVEMLHNTKLNQSYLGFCRLEKQY